MLENRQTLIGKLLDTLPQEGRVAWIGVRPQRRIPLKVVEQVLALPGSGLEGDHYQGRLESKRQVTLINQEHIAAIASMLGKDTLDPGILRRNIVVRGINLNALKDRRFQVGEAILEVTGFCHPCSRMEYNLGPGGYNAVRGHGGITAKVVRQGLIRLGDTVSLLH